MAFGLKLKLPGMLKPKGVGAAPKPKIIPGAPRGGLTTVGKAPTQTYGSLKELRKATAAKKPPAMPKPRSLGLKSAPIGGASKFKAVGKLKARIEKLSTR